MKKGNVEKDLVRIFKTKNQDDRCYTFLQIINGTYNYEIAYLNTIPYNEMLIYLEKVMMIVTERINFNLSSHDCMRVFIEFIEKIPSFVYRKLEKKSLQTIKYDLLLVKERLKNNPIMVKRALAFLLSFNMLLALSQYNKKSTVISDINNLSKFHVESALFPSSLRHKKETNYDIASTIQEPEALENPGLEEDINPNSQVVNDYADQLEEKTEEFEYQEIIIEETQPESIMTFDTTRNNIEYGYDVIGTILNMYGLTEEQFNVLKSIVIAESKADSYEDGYAVINTVYNRTISQRWSNYVSYLNHENAGFNLYYQAITSGQFVVYENGNYKKYLDVFEGPVYDAIIDFLISQKSIHNYLSFRSAGTYLDEYEQFTPNGNKYFDLLLENDLVINENNLSRSK